MELNNSTFSLNRSRILFFSLIFVDGGACFCVLLLPFNFLWKILYNINVRVLVRGEGFVMLNLLPAASSGRKEDVVNIDVFIGIVMGIASLAMGELVIEMFRIDEGEFEICPFFMFVLVAFITISFGVISAFAFGSWWLGV